MAIISRVSGTSGAGRALVTPFGFRLVGAVPGEVSTLSTLIISHVGVISRVSGTSGDGRSNAQKINLAFNFLFSS